MALWEATTSRTIADECCIVWFLIHEIIHRYMAVLSLSRQQPCAFSPTRPPSNPPSSCLPSQCLVLNYIFPLSIHAHPTVFLDMHQDGLIIPAKAREALRAWRSLSKLAGADVTHGAAGTILRALGMTEEQQQQEEEEEGDKGREGFGKQELAHLQSLGEALQQSEVFKQEDDGVRAFYLNTYVPSEGLVVEASNAVFDDLFCGARELMACQVHRQTASALLFAA